MGYKDNPRKVVGTVKSMGDVTTKGLRKVVDKLSLDDWIYEDENSPNHNRNTKILDNVKHITLKFTRVSDVHHVTVSEKHLELWENIQPILRTIENFYSYENGYFPIILLAKLKKGGVILPHTDGTMEKYAPHKIHIPIATNSKSYFFVNGQRFVLNEGEMYEVDNIAQHSVMNAGDTDRIHLIVEYIEGKE